MSAFHGYDAVRQRNDLSSRLVVLFVLGQKDEQYVVRSREQGALSCSFRKDLPFKFLASLAWTIFGASSDEVNSAERVIMQ